jgi:hypothetical protein
MSKFKVGDRVRVVDSSDLPQHFGKETVITEVMGYAECPTPEYEDDVWYCTDLTFDDGERCVYPAGALAPIYDGREKTSWSECAWKPNHLRVC